MHNALFKSTYQQSCSTIIAYFNTSIYYILWVCNYFHQSQLLLSRWHWTARGGICYRIFPKRQRAQLSYNFFPNSSAHRRSHFASQSQVQSYCEAGLSPWAQQFRWSDPGRGTAYKYCNSYLFIICLFL